MNIFLAEADTGGYDDLGERIRRAAAIASANEEDIVFEFKRSSRQYATPSRSLPRLTLDARRAELLAKLPFDWAGDFVDLQSAAPAPGAPGTSAALLQALSVAADTAHALYAAQTRVARAVLERIVAANGITATE
jgi:hypothetical protein